MPNALRKASEPSAIQGGAQGNLRSALRPVDAGALGEGAGVDPAADADVMIDPLHPMHRELLARISISRSLDEELTRPQRFAAVFYAAILAWGLVWLLFQAVIALL